MLVDEIFSSEEEMMIKFQKLWFYLVFCGQTQFTNYQMTHFTPRLANCEFIHHCITTFKVGIMWCKKYLRVCLLISMT